jgi:hypothetical protein
MASADRGAHLWAEQFDTPRADLLQTQDAIVTHLAHAIDLQLIKAEGGRVKRTPAANATPRTWLSNATRSNGRPDGSARRRMQHTRSANRRVDELGVDPHLSALDEAAFSQGGARDIVEALGSSFSRHRGRPQT